MINRLFNLVKLRPGEWQIALPMLFLLTISTMVVELAQVVATTGFISNVGAQQLPWVWIVDMIALLLFGGVYALVVDHTQRVQLVSWMLGGFAVAYLLIQLLFSYGVPPGINYFLLFILADQQFFIFPLAFWALANDVYSISEAKRIFPIIGAGFALGSIIGNSMAASSASLFARFGGEVHQLLGLAAILLLLALVLVQVTFRNKTISGRQSKETTINVRESVQMGLDFYNNVPLFRYLSISILLVYLGYTVVQYNFLFVMNQTFDTDLQFQAFYGSYKVALIIATLLFQWLVSSRMLEKTPLKTSFMMLPVTVVLAAGSGLALAGLTGGAVGVFIQEVIERAWDQPAKKSLQGLIPDERRGRVSTFLDTYVLAGATIVACVFLLLLFFTASMMQWSDSVMTIIYLVAAMLSGAGAIWATWRVRQEYDQSMLNWRLSRRGRRGLTGVMNKLDF